MADARQPPPPRRSRGWRWIALAVLCLPLLIVGALVGLVASGAFDERLARLASDQANAHIAGRVEIDRLGLGFGGVVVQGVRLTPPDAPAPAITIERVEAVPVLDAGLLRGRVHVRRVEVQAPSIDLVLDEAGSNLQRIFEPRTPAAVQDVSEGGDFQLRVDRLLVERGRVQVVQAGETLLSLDGLEIDTSIRADPQQAALAGHVAAALHAPVEAPVRVDFDVALDDGFQTVRAERLLVRSGTSSLALSGGGRVDGSRLVVEDLQATIDPADVRPHQTIWRPTVPVELRGKGSWTEGLAAAELSLAQREAGSLAIDAEFQPLSGSWRLQATADDLDPAGLDERAPAGRVALRADLAGTGSERAEGRVEIPSLQLGGQTAGPLVLEGRLRGTRAEVARLEVRLPGATLHARGEASEERGDLRFDLRSTDLRRALAATRRLAAAAGIQLEGLPNAHGDLRLEGRAHGSWREPSVEASATAGRLGLDDLELQAVRAQVRVTDLPHAPRGNVRLQGERFGGTGWTLVEPHADLQLEGEAIRGSFEGQTGAGRVHGSLALVQSGGFERLRVHHLELEMPRSRWWLQRPFQLSLAQGIELSQVELRSDAGARIETSGTQRREALDLTLAIADLPIATLPPILVPGELGAAGVLQAEVAIGGSTAQPTGTARIALRDFGFFGVHGADVDIGVDLQGRQMAATLHLLRRDARLVGRARADWPIAESTPLEATLDLTSIHLAEVGEILGLAEPIAGSLGGRIQLAGTLSSPRGQVDLHVDELAARGIEGAIVVLQAAVDQGLTTELRLIHGESRLQIGLSADAIPLDQEGLEATPLQLRIDGTELALQTLAQLAGRPDPGLGGRLAIEGRLQGTLRTPAGRLTLGLDQIRAGGVGPVSGTVALVADELRTALSLDTHLGDRPLLAGSWGVGTSIARLLDPATRDAASLRGELVAHDFDLRVFGSGGRRRRRGPMGIASGTLRLGGSIGAPTAQLQGQVQGLGLHRVTWGDLSIDLGYEEEALAAHASLRSATGGAATVDAGWTLDLSPAGIAAGSLDDLASQPLDLRLEASQLDLAFLAGLSPDLHTAAGRLDGTVRIRGSLPLPTLEGALALYEGRFGYTGHGEIDQVAVALEFTPDAIRLRRLDARADGRLHVEGAALLGSDDRWTIGLEVESRRFALVTGDLVRGWLELDARIDGEADVEGLDLSIALQRTQVELADAPGKDIQSLDPHPDFVVVGGRFPTPPPKEEGRERGAVWPALVHLFTERPIEVEGTDVEVTADADLRAAITDAGLRIAGSVEVQTGQAVVIGKRFVIDRGRIYYTGAEEPGDPRLDVVVRHESPYATVTVTVGGTAQRPTTHLSSNPPYSEAQIAELIATGRLQGGGATAGAGGAASALGTVLASQLQRGIAGKLPVDVIAFEAGEDDPFVGSRLEAGSWLTERIYLGYARRFEGEALIDERDRQNANEVRFEYLLAPRWSLEITYGDAHVGGADLVWTRDF